MWVFIHSPKGATYNINSLTPSGNANSGCVDVMFYSGDGSFSIISFCWRLDSGFFCNYYLSKNIFDNVFYFGANLANHWAKIAV